MLYTHVFHHILGHYSTPFFEKFRERQPKVHEGVSALCGHTLLDIQLTVTDKQRVTLDFRSQPPTSRKRTVPWQELMERRRSKSPSSRESRIPLKPPTLRYRFPLCRHACSVSGSRYLLLTLQSALVDSCACISLSNMRLFSRGAPNDLSCVSSSCRV